jgi:serine protease inhibitor
VQECVLKVAEEGVEAAAVTAIAMAPAGAALRPPRIHYVRFDRPFGVVVLDGSGSVPLFTAWQATAPRGG